MVIYAQANDLMSFTIYVSLTKISKIIKKEPGLHFVISIFSVVIHIIHLDVTILNYLKV